MMKFQSLYALTHHYILLDEENAHSTFANSPTGPRVSQFASSTDSTVSECIMWPQKPLSTVCKALPLKCLGGRGVV